MAAAGGVAFAGRSPGIARPAGFFGSKKPSGRGRVETSSMPRAATPASRRPGFKSDARIVRVRGLLLRDDGRDHAERSKSRNRCGFDDPQSEIRHPKFHFMISFSIAPIRSISIR